MGPFLRDLTCGFRALRATPAAALAAVLAALAFILEKPAPLAMTTGGSTVLVRAS